MSPRTPPSDSPPIIMDMPAAVDPELVAQYRMVCADALREFGGRGLNATQREILRRMQRLNMRFTSTDVPRVNR